jgi:hypothetical protein
MTTALEGVRGQRHAPAALYPRERAGTHCIGGWVGPRAGIDRFVKSRPPPAFDPRTVQPVASRYTDYDTRPASSWMHKTLYFNTFQNKLRNLTFIHDYLVNVQLQRRNLYFRGSPNLKTNSLWLSQLSICSFLSGQCYQMFSNPSGEFFLLYWTL